MGFRLANHVKEKIIADMLQDKKIEVKSERGICG